MAENEQRLHDRRNVTDRRENTRIMQEISSTAVENYNNSMLSQQNTDSEIRLGSLIVNRLRKVVTINDIPISLSPKEFKIVTYLAANPNRVVKTQDIVKNVWENDSRATKADVHQYIHMLRKKIEDDPKNPKLLMTVKGFGYELRVENTSD